MRWNENAKATLRGAVVAGAACGLLWAYGASSTVLGLPSLDSLAIVIGVFAVGFPAGIASGHVADAPVSTIAALLVAFGADWALAAADPAGPPSGATMVALAAEYALVFVPLVCGGHLLGVGARRAAAGLLATRAARDATYRRSE